MVYNRERDAKRMALFPSLDYRGLYNVLIQLLEVIPLIQTGVDGMSFSSALFNLSHSLCRTLPTIFYDVSAFCGSFFFYLIHEVLSQALIGTILCVMPFIEQDLIDNLPSLVASSIVHLPTSLHGYIVQVLCCFLLPLTMGMQLESIIDCRNIQRK